MLQAKNLSKEVAGKQILSNIDISIQPGQIVTLIGSSGCGKSTLLRNLSLVETPSSGEVEIDDFKVRFPINKKNNSFSNVHPGVTIVFQQFHLWPHLRVEENLLMPLKQNGISNSRFKDLTQYFEIDMLLDRFPYEISVGQRQRIAFVRAVLLKPKYLLLDEVTSALDIQHIGKLLSYLNRLKDDGVGILLSTHLIGFASKASDKVIFMDRGQIIERGNNEILRSPKTELLTKFLNYLEYEPKST